MHQTTCCIFSVRYMCLLFNHKATSCLRMPYHTKTVKTLQTQSHFEHKKRYKTGHYYISISFSIFLLPGEVSHFHHDHTHLFRKHDDVISTVIPFGDLSVQFDFLKAEQFNLWGKNK